METDTLNVRLPVTAKRTFKALIEAVSMILMTAGYVSQ